MRRFQQLNDTQIRDIYAGFLSGTPKLAIAKRLNIDNSTVHYHINKVKDYPTERIVALIAPKCGRGHTFFKCGVCGKSFDNIKHDEFQAIARLSQRVRDLEYQLSLHAKPLTSSPPRLIVCVSG
jgi:hypothetical protein